jgi:hypothetical protein
MSRAYLSPLMADGYIAQTLPKKPKSPLQRYRLLGGLMGQFDAGQGSIEISDFL